LPTVTSSFVASVAFLRIQDFASRPASEQARLRAQLEAVVAVTTAELRASRAFRDALADAAPGLEASLVPKGACSDASLRSYELFTRDRGELARRRRSFAALSAAAAVALLANGVGWRISQHGHAACVGDLASKYRETTVQGERYVRALVQRVKTQ
jgi:hypothetical protein